LWWDQHAAHERIVYEEAESIIGAQTAFSGRFLLIPGKSSNSTKRRWSGLVARRAEELAVVRACDRILRSWCCRGCARPPVAARQDQLPPPLLRDLAEHMAEWDEAFAAGAPPDAMSPPPWPATARCAARPHPQAGKK